MSLLVLITMAALAAGFVLLALFRPLPAMDDAGRAPRREALRAQLREAERDLADGRLTAHEHALAEAEIARRLFRLEDEAAVQSEGTRWRRPALWGSALAVPVIAFASYLVVGAPNLSAQPHAAREDVQALLARAESRLRRTPDDARGWAAVAPVYTRLGRTEEAAAAYERALKAPKLPPRIRSAMIAEWAEASTIGAGKPVAAARDRLEQALALDEENVKARFLLAMAREEEGTAAEAALAWRELLDRHPQASEGWAQVARGRLARLEVAATIPEEERGARIDGMVAGLASRLEAEPNDLDGWVRLVRSYTVLGRAGAARAALDRARIHFAEDAAAVARLEAGARAAGVAVE